MEDEVLFQPNIRLKHQYIPDYSELGKLIEYFRGLGLRIVLTMGTFDIIHVGHARYVRTARKKGDLLIVGVDSDEKVKKRKGPNRPVVPQDERIEMLGHLRYVDVITIKNFSDPKWHLIKTVRPDVLIATEETYTKEQVKNLEEFCGEVIVLERQAETTTTAKLRLLRLIHLNPALNKLQEVIDSIRKEMQ